ncbi:RNA pyrophosphohydrolase [uncultured Porticoccus sp.]|uniref:RNA pyrophosphohydrolase n=1 Tax=uncultured Porticoccus sp. TaxID=1256050 RepID=UPI0026257489|nr:RNA pyrophosphohydrolase [uncultured Porticoccus sp.]
MVDREGFRPNVGIMISDGAGRLLWARRIGQDAWQFPQGGINPGEKPEHAMYRELYEEIGLEPDDVELLACTRGWLRYRLPRAMQRRHSKPLCIGQKQKWYMLKLLAGEDRIRLDLSGKPEFDHWQWVSYWYPVNQVIEFKQEVYRRALKELAPMHCELERQS